MRTTFAIGLLLLLGIGAALPAQTKYLGKNGHIWFYSHTPLEDIEAHNTEAAGVLNAGTGEIVFQLLIKSFKFKRALMEEHFNENYMESSKYPRSEFKGRITNLSAISFDKPGIYKAEAEGNLTIHNKTNPVRPSGTIEVREGRLFLKSVFDVAPEDYGIEIPGAVRDKIGKKMQVTVDMAFDPIQK